MPLTPSLPTPSSPSPSAPGLSTDRTPAPCDGSHSDVWARNLWWTRSSLCDLHQSCTWKSYSSFLAWQACSDLILRIPLSLLTSSSSFRILYWDGSSHVQSSCCFGWISCCSLGRCRDRASPQCVFSDVCADWSQGRSVCHKARIKMVSLPIQIEIIRTTFKTYCMNKLMSF